MELRVLDTPEEMGAVAARAVADALRAHLHVNTSARLIFAAAPSQSPMLAALLQEPGIDWRRVTAFHMDEYLGLPDTAPQRFGNWLRAEFFDRVHPGAVHLMNPGADPAAACRSYVDLLGKAPIDMALLGVGTNGHLAFNDPPADLNDPETVRVVTLDAMCREQQVFDGCFASLDEVPRQAMTLTIPALLSAKRIFGCVPGEHKSAAVAAMLDQPISGDCPATALRTHPHCVMFVDRAASSRSKLREEL